MLAVLLGIDGDLFRIVGVLLLNPLDHLVDNLTDDRIDRFRIGSLINNRIDDL